MTKISFAIYYGYYAAVYMTEIENLDMLKDLRTAFNRPLLSGSVESIGAPHPNTQRYMWTCYDLDQIEPLIQLAYSVTKKENTSDYVVTKDYIIDNPKRFRCGSDDRSEWIKSIEKSGFGEVGIQAFIDRGGVNPKTEYSKAT